MMKGTTGSFFFLAAVVIFFPHISRAATDPLRAVYEQRSDLQTVFDASTGLAVSPKAGFLTSLTDWAKQYGWQEYPTELATYAPTIPAPKSTNAALPSVSARDYIVIDESSGQILAAQGADEVWPIASITKLMTAQVAIGNGINMDAVGSVQASDEVGGARLQVTDGTTFKVKDLFYAMLIGSANNAANAIARLSGGNFVNSMNVRADELQLPHTHFKDASGIEPENVSTAREVAIFADAAFALDSVKSIVTTAKKDIYAISLASWHHLKTTNWMLYYPQFDDVYVTGGKTGYLDESGWNVVERLRPSASAKNKELLIVLFGADSRQASFDDANALANWVWTTFKY